jgi:hypothetical protein
MAPIIHALITGALVAAAIDFSAYKTWNQYDNMFTFDYRLGLRRWLQGAVISGLTYYAGVYLV